LLFCAPKAKIKLLNNAVVREGEEVLMTIEFASVLEHSFVPNCFHCAIQTAVIVLELNVTVVVKIFLYSFTYFASIHTGIDFFYFPLLFHCKCVCVCVCVCARVCVCYCVYWKQNSVHAVSAW